MLKEKNIATRVTPELYEKIVKEVNESRIYYNKSHFLREAIKEKIGIREKLREKEGK